MRILLEPIWFTRQNGEEEGAEEGGRADPLEGGSRRKNTPSVQPSVCVFEQTTRSRTGPPLQGVPFLVHTLESTSYCIDSDTSMRYCIDTAVSASIEAPAERVKYAASSAGVLQEFCARYTHPCQLLNTHR